MRSAGIYLVEAEIGTVRFCSFPQGETTITFRVGTAAVIKDAHSPPLYLTA